MENKTMLTEKQEFTVKANFYSAIQKELWNDYGIKYGFDRLPNCYSDFVMESISSEFEREGKKTEVYSDEYNQRVADRITELCVMMVKHDFEEEVMAKAKARYLNEIPATLKRFLDKENGLD